MGHIRVLVDTLKQNLNDEVFDTELQLRQRVDDVLLYLHRIYNVERSGRLGYAETQNLFRSEALLGTRLQNGTFCLHHLTLEPWVYAVDNYQTIGSGFQLANLVLKQHSRAPNFYGKNLSDLEIKYNVLVTSYAINEVKAIEPYTGGKTKVVLIDKTGYKEMPDETVRDLYNTMVNEVSTKLGTWLSDDESIKEMLAKIFPSG